MTPRVAILACLSPSGEQGGAERFFGGLAAALQRDGLAVEVLDIYTDERDFEGIKETYLRFYDLELAAYDGVISAKAPSYVARHRNHVCYLMHTMRVFYDMFDSVFPRPTRDVLEQRHLIHALDTAALQRPRHLFAIGTEVAGRLRRFNGLQAEVMHHPTSLAGLHEGNFDYFLLPGRLHPWKRAELAIEAMNFVSAPIELLVTGTGESEQQLRHMAGPDARVRFVGRVSDAALSELYANALAIIFTPKSEDLGLVTLEAFQSAKPVVTCTDSGEPARIVKDGISGYVCEPQPQHLAAALEALARSPVLARKMGHAGRASAASITWDHVAGSLRKALGFSNGNVHA